MLFGHLGGAGPRKYAPLEEHLIYAPRAPYEPWATWRAWLAQYRELLITMREIYKMHHSQRV